jgi:pimeloyl-ACP methyl ester carboxylesterase
MSDFTDHYFDFDGITLHYVEAGSGPLVIFYHGFPLFWFSFHHQMTALKDHYRVVAVDGLGVNLSSKPTDLDKYKLPNLAAQLDALANHLAPGEPFSLVGHDWGGALAWSFAQAYPDRLEKVIGINAPPTNQLLHLLQTNQEQRKRSSYMWLMRGGKTHTLITEDGARRLWKNAYAKFRDLPHFTKAHDEAFREALAVPGAVDGGINWYRANIPLLQDLGEAECWPSPTASTPVPALLIWGETDTTFVAEFIDELDQYATNLEVKRLPDVGHTPMLEAPSLTTSIIEEFLAR